MANGSLNDVEAAKVWVLRECGWKIRDIQTRFDVDPRRIYEVLERKKCPASLERAKRLFRKKFPDISIVNRFRPHEQRLIVKQKAALDEPTLPGI